MEVKNEDILIAEVHGINNYDRLLFLEIVCTVFGYLPGIFALPTYIFFVIGLCLIPRVISDPMLFSVRPVLMILLLMTIYEVISLLWTPQMASGISSLLILIRNSTLFISILILAGYARNPKNSIINGWIVAFTLTAIVAFWEIYTGSHLPNARERIPGMNTIIDKHSASVTFYNPNTYSLFIISALPFILYGLTMSKKYLKIIMYILLFAYLAIVLVNSSRSALLCTCIMFFVYIWYNFKGSASLKQICIFIILVVFFLYVFSDILLEYLLFRLENKAMFSDNSRIILWDSSWNSFLDSYGFGCGIGSMREVLKGMTRFGIFYSHNLILEMMLEGGILFGCVFVAYVFKITISARRALQWNSKMLLYSVVLSLPFYAVLNSSYMLAVFIWTYFASVYVFSKYSEQSLSH